MSPNLFLMAHKVSHPWKLFQGDHQETTVIKHIDRPGRYPLPGIYLDDLVFGHALIAIPTALHENPDRRCSLIPVSSTTSGTSSRATSTSAGLDVAVEKREMTLKEQERELFLSDEEAQAVWMGNRITSSKLYRRLKHAKTADGKRYQMPKLSGKRYDLSEWKFLREPMEIEYQQRARRYLFKAEVKTFRTMRTTARSEDVVRSERRIGLAEYFLLDDCHTWVLDKFDGKSVREFEHFWRVDWDASLMRLEGEEAEESKKLLKYRKPMFVVESDGGEIGLDGMRYLWLLTYVGLLEAEE